MKYYRAKEARHVLGGITANKLKHYVDNGILHRYFPPGNKQGMYSKQEVDTLATELRRFYEDTETDEHDATDRKTGALDGKGRSPIAAC